MKILKKIFIMGLPFAVLFSFAACGGSAETEEPEADAEDSAKVLRIGMECAYAPFNWTQPNDSNGAVPIAGTEDFVNGYDIIYATKIADALGYQLEVYKIEWDGLIPAVQTDKIDAVVAGMCMTDKRRENIDFSDIYYQADLVAITMKDSSYANAKSLEDLKGATATSQLSTVWYDILNQIPEANITPAIKTVPGVIVSLTSGKSDIVTVDMPTAMAAAVANPDIIILSLDKGDFIVDKGEVDMGIGVKKGNTELLEAINGVVTTITEEDRAQMMEEAIEIQPLS